MQVEIKDTISFFKHSLLDFLAQAFHYPYKLKDIQSLQEKAKEIEMKIKTFCDTSSYEKFKKFKDYLDSINNVDKLTEVEIQFVELDKPYNLHRSLYESISRQGYYDLALVSELRTIYNKLGIDPKEEPDLLSVELAFLSFLYFNKAIGNNVVDEIIEYFIETHFDTWVPKLAENLKSSDYFYFSLLGDFMLEAIKCIKSEV